MIKRIGMTKRIKHFQRVHRINELTEFEDWSYLADLQCLKDLKHRANIYLTLDKFN